MNKIIIFLILAATLAHARVAIPLIVFPMDIYDGISTNDATVKSFVSTRSVIISNDDSVTNQIENVINLIDDEYNKQANDLILQTLSHYVEIITLSQTVQLLSNFDLDVEPDAVSVIRDISDIYYMMNESLQYQLIPVMMQLKTKYNLLKDDDDPDILANISEFNIAIISISTLNVLLTTIDTFDIDTFAILLTKIDTIDSDAFDVMLTKIDSIDSSTLDMLLTKIDTLNSDTLDILLTKIDTIDNDSLIVLLSKIDSLDVNSLDLMFQDTSYLSPEIVSMVLSLSNTLTPDELALIIPTIHNSTDLVIAYTDALSDRINYWQRLYSRKYAASDSFPFFLSLSNERSITEDVVDNLEQWAELSPNITSIEYIPFTADLNNIRVIGEVKTPKSNEEVINQTDELDFFIDDLGYDAMFVVSEMEDPIYLKKLMTEYKQRGIKIGLVIGQQESNRSVYQSINAMEYIYSELAPLADFALLGWRMTSIPHFGEYATRHENAGKNVDSTLESKSYALVQAYLIRKYNPTIPLLGESFYFINGATSYNRKFDWTAGNVVLGLGNELVNTKKVIEHVYDETDICVPLVIGPNYYWKGFPQHSVGLDLTPKGILSSRSRIELDSLSSDQIPMTLTIVGDMLGDRTVHGAECSDSLTKSKWRFVK